MAAPTTLFVNGTGVLATTGESNGLLATMNQTNGPDRIRVGFSGTFSGVTIAVRARPSGLSEFYPVPGISLTSRLPVGDSTAIGLMDDTNQAFEFDISKCDAVEVWSPAGTLTDLNVEQVNFKSEDYGSPIVVAASANNSTFSAGITLNGVTGANDITIPDNLADAFTIQEGSTAYVTFVTTNSAEKINILKTLGFGGTTGNNIIALTDNLADALSFKEASTTYLSFVTTNSAEKIVASKPLDLADVGTVAAAGSAQGDAAAIANQTTYVSAADGTKGVVLPAAAAGIIRLVYNTHASNGLKVYPASGDDINDGTGDASVTIEGKTLAIFMALDSTTWAAIFTANT